MWIAGQLLHPCRQLVSPFAGDEGPVVDIYPALTGGIEILLCVAGRVVVPEQTSYCGESRPRDLFQSGQTWGRILMNGFLSDSDSQA